MKQECIIFIQIDLKDLIMAALTTLNITEKNANNSLSVTVKVNVTKEGVFTTTLSKEDVDKNVPRNYSLI